MPRRAVSANVRNPGHLRYDQECLGSIKRFWQKMYGDYVGLALVLSATILLQIFVEPFHRMFSLDNMAIQYPHTLKERVPVWMLCVLAAGVPLLVILVWTTIARLNPRTLHVTLLGFFISLVLTTFLTDLIKNSVGRPRPDLIARCKPAKDTPPHELVTFLVCTETDHHILHDGWRSFPSGHSSSAFSGLGYLTFFMSGQMRVFRPRADLTRFLFAFIPLLGAALIAISRCEDYRHDVYDVCVGSLLGISIAYFSYRRYFPDLRSPGCDIPFSKSDEVAEGSFRKVDEEIGIPLHDLDSEDIDGGDVESGIAR